MNKFILFAIALAFLSSSAFAEVELIYPIEQRVESGQGFELGSVQAGETVELVFNANVVSQNAARWTSVELSGLPEQWRSEKVEQQNPNTLAERIMISSNAEPATHSITATLKDNSNQLASESVSLIVKVRQNLIHFEVQNASLKTTAGEPVKTQLNVSSESIARHKIRIDSTLPSPWMKGFEVELQPKANQNIELKITPPISGKKNFQLNILDSQTREVLKSFDMQVEVRPTLKSKYQEALYGFPFFSPGLLPYYLINGFLSQLLP